MSYSHSLTLRDFEPVSLWWLQGVNGVLIYSPVSIETAVSSGLPCGDNLIHGHG